MSLASGHFEEWNETNKYHFASICQELHLFEHGRYPHPTCIDVICLHKPFWNTFTQKLFDQEQLRF